MPVGPLSADVGLLLGRATAMGTGNVLFLFGFGLYLVLSPRVTFLLGAATESYASAHDYSVYVVSSVHNIYNKVKNGQANACPIVI